MNTKLALLILLLTIGNILLVLSSTLDLSGWPHGLMLGTAIVLNITAGGGLVAMVMQQKKMQHQS